jgi:hypothetical protein
MLMALQLSAPAAAPVVGHPCGDVRVTYPFGFGPSSCYCPGFNLTCDTSRNPPRLLLGLPDSTMPGGRSIAITYAHLNGYIDFPLPDIGGHMVSSRSELIIFGCAEAIRA